MFTNGTILSGKISDDLANSKLDFLKVSIDGGDSEIYKKIRGYDLVKVIENVKSFHNKSFIPVGMESVLSKYTIQTVTKLPDIVRAMGGSLLEIRLLNWVDPNVETNSVYNIAELSRIKSALENICSQCDIRLVMTLPDNEDVKNCTTFTELYVDYKGDVAPCYFLNQTPIGNLINDPFEAVWNGENIKKYRRNYLDGKATPDCCCSRGLIINNRIKI